jgi:hypothetical protein
MFEELLQANPQLEYKVNFSATFSASGDATSILNNELLKEASWEIFFNKAIALVIEKDYNGALAMI